MPQYAQLSPRFYLSYDEYEGQRLPEEVPGGEIWLLLDTQTNLPTIVDGRTTQALARPGPRLKSKQWRLKFKKQVHYPWDVRLFSGPWSPQFRLAITATLLDPALYYERLDRQYHDKWPQHDEVGRILQKPLSKAVNTAFSLVRQAGSSVAPLTIQYVSKLQRGFDLTSYLQGLRETSTFREYGVQVQVVFQGVSTINSRGESVLDPQRQSLRDYEYVIAMAAATLEGELREAKKWLQQHAGGHRPGESELVYRERLYTYAAAYYAELEPLIVPTILEIVGTTSYLWEEGTRLAATIFKDLVRQQFETVTRPLYRQAPASAPASSTQTRFPSALSANRDAQIRELYEAAAAEKWKLSPPKDQLVEDLSIEVEHEGLTIAVRVPGEYPKAPLFIQMMEGKGKVRRSQREVNELIDSFSYRDTIYNQIRGLIDGTIQRRFVASTLTQPMPPSSPGQVDRSLELLRQQRAPTIPVDIYWQQQMAPNTPQWDASQWSGVPGNQQVIQGPPAAYPASEMIGIEDSDLTAYPHPFPAQPAAAPPPPPEEPAAGLTPQRGPASAPPPAPSPASPPAYTQEAPEEPTMLPPMSQEAAAPGPGGNPAQQSLSVSSPQVPVIQGPQPGKISDTPTEQLSPSQAARLHPPVEQRDAAEEALASQPPAVRNVSQARQAAAQEARQPDHPPRKVAAQPSGAARPRGQMVKSRPPAMKPAAYQKQAQKGEVSPRRLSRPSSRPQNTNADLPTIPTPPRAYRRSSRHTIAQKHDASLTSAASQEQPLASAPPPQAHDGGRAQTQAAEVPPKKKRLSGQLPGWFFGKKRSG